MKKIALVAALFAMTVGAANADVIVQYDTAPSQSNATLTASTVDAAVSADLMAAGSGINAASGSTWNWNSWDTANTSFASAVAGGEFWSWGFDVTAANTSVDLSDFDIRLDRSGTGPDDFEIQASVNGGTPFSLLSFNYNDADLGVDFIGVSLASLPTLVTGDSVVFTLAAWNAEGSAGTFDLETIDFGGSDPRSLRINGTVTTNSIPEPASVALIGLAFAGFGLIRRRK
jgi:hypothetical protein